jgi:RNA polymerase sigma-70 factor (ECF subfamily)
MNRGQSDFARVYSEHVWLVYGFFAYRLGDRHQAEDLTQAAFERALRAWSRFDPRRSSERTWLLSIARNLLTDHHRRERHRRTEQLDAVAAPAVPGPEEHGGSNPELIAALEGLSDREREVIALRYGADLTGPEIAALLELNLANVQQIASRALRSLKESLERPAASVPNRLSGDQRSQPDQH